MDMGKALQEKGNTAFINTNTKDTEKRMVVYSLCSLFVLSIFLNIRNITYYWKRRRTLAIMCVLAIMSYASILLMIKGI